MEQLNFAEIWKTLSAIDCSGHTEKKNTGRAQLTYLSWTWAWSILMSKYPESTYTVREWDGRPWLDDPVAGVLVMTEVNVGGNVRTMWLPAMDGANNALKDAPYTYTVKGYNGPIEKQVAAVDMMAINKAIMRCLVKNLAMFGLGINIYAGEDLPIGQDEDKSEKKATAQNAEKRPVQASAQKTADDTAKVAPSAPAPEKSAPDASQQKKQAAKKSAAPSTKAREAWAAYRKLPNVARLSDAERNADWAAMLKETVGKVKSAEITDAEWDKVLDRIAVEAAI